MVDPAAVFAMKQLEVFDEQTRKSTTKEGLLALITSLA